MKTLKLGNSGELVKTLQRALGINADGHFGKQTENSVKAWQQLHGLKADGIVGPKTRHSLGITSRVINEIIVHCTATKENQEVTIEQIDKWHKIRGFVGIGYHYVIGLDGKIYEGRDIDKVGAHCTNHNAKSIGVCYVGGLDSDGKPKDTRTHEQKVSLVALLRRLRRIYPSATIHGHREFANKACPCFDARKEYAVL